MKKGQQTKKLDAFALFPELMHQGESVKQLKGKSKKIRTPVDDTGERQPVSPVNMVLPPSPPDLSWLWNGHYEDQDEPQDIPTALVLMKGGDARDSVSLTLKEFGYQFETTKTVSDAVHRLTSTDYEAVVMHTGFGGEVSFAESTVHNYITWLPMPRRRLIFYILVGAEFHTLYNLEALCYSVNLVVNDADVEHLAAILRKGFRDYEELFGPFLESLDGKR